MKTLTQGDPRIAEFLDDYLVKRLPTLEILAKYEFSYPTFYQSLRNLQIKKRDRRQIKVNDAFFDHLTPASAWMLGLWFADGSIEYRDGSYSVRIGFASEPLVERVRELIGFEGTAKKRHDRDFWQLNITSQHLYDALNDLGVSPYKYKRDHLPIVSDDLLPHLIRGIADGDGYWEHYRQEKGTLNLRFGIAYPNERFLESVRDRLHAALGVTGSIRIRTDEECCDLRYYQTDTFKIVDWVYRDSNGLRYDDKFQRAVPFLNRS